MTQEDAIGGRQLGKVYSEIKINDKARQGRATIPRRDEAMIFSQK